MKYIKLKILINILYSDDQREEIKIQIKQHRKRC